MVSNVINGNQRVLAERVLDLEVPFHELGVERLGSDVIDRRQRGSTGRSCRLVLRQSLAATEGSLERAVAGSYEIRATPRFRWIHGTARDGEARDLRKVRCKVVEKGARVEVAEEPYTSANDCLFTEGAPCKTGAWLKYHLLHAAKDAALACRNHLVERNGGIMREILEGQSWYRNTIGLAYAAGIAIRTECQSQLQFLVNADLILEVQAKAVDGQRLRG